MQHARRLAQAGFTLVELLIVAIILSILAAIVVPQFSASTDEARIAALDANLANMRSAVELYYQQHGHYPSAVAAGGTFGAVNTADAFASQLTKYSSAAGAASNTGGPSDATFKYGPYIKKGTVPVEPISGSNAVEIVTVGTLGLTATAGDPGGWKFDNKTGQIIANTAANQAR